MIKIITAIGNPNLNNTLRKYEEFKVIGNDILYSEGILDILKNDSEIDYLILGENYDKEIENLIYRIREINSKIKIIIVVNKKNQENINLYRLGVYELFYENEDIENIVNYLKTKNIEYLNEELRNEIDNLKKIILDNKKKSNDKIIKNICIGMVGTSGIGITTSCILFAKSLNKKNKILIIDFNLINSQIGFLYNKKIDYSKIDENNINDLIFNVEKNIDILIGLDVLKKYKKINYDSLRKYFESLKNKYDYIFVDTFNDNNLEENKLIFNYFDYIFFHSGIDQLEINKNNKILKRINMDWKISNDKIKIILYRINLLELIKIIKNKKNFKELKIIGIINKSFFIKNNLIRENKLLSKILIKRIMIKIKK